MQQNDTNKEVVLPEGMLQGMHLQYPLMYSDGCGDMVFNGGMDGRFTILHDGEFYRLTQDEIDAKNAEFKRIEEDENEMFAINLGGMWKFFTRYEIRAISHVGRELNLLEEAGF